jgi:uncharacterized damage-inducible protein DinB
MNASLLPLAEIFRLNTGLLYGCVEGMTDAQMRRRIGNRTNNAGFIVLHVVDSRFHLASLLGSPVKSPYAEKFAAAKRIEDVRDIPPLEELKKEWNAVSSALMSALQSAGDEDLSKSSPTRFPISDASMLGTITFLAQHESYHIGQLGFLRKELGFGAVEWGEEVRMF